VDRLTASRRLGIKLILYMSPIQFRAREIGLDWKVLVLRSVSLSSPEFFLAWFQRFKPATLMFMRL
jgi:hypothetical protein